MQFSKLLHTLPLAAVLLTLPFATLAQTSHSFDAAARQTASLSTTLQQEVHADMNFLADDELHGRGSATRDEHIAALFVASQLQSLGLAPGGDNGTFVQKSALPDPLPARVQQRIAKFQDVPRKETWNAIGILRGTTLPNEVILLTAHLDHLGIGPANAAGDTIYNGADDDASGTTAVLTLAHILANGPRPKRTIVFALFGSEELGGFGNRAFLAHPPVPLASIVANLEFEMIGGSGWNSLAHRIRPHEPRPRTREARRTSRRRPASKGELLPSIRQLCACPTRHHCPDCLQLRLTQGLSPAQ
jgi:hypothetical protein